MEIILWTSGRRIFWVPQWRASATDADTEHCLLSSMYSLSISMVIIAIFNLNEMQECELHMQADHFCPFGVMPAKDRVKRAKGKKKQQPGWIVMRCHLILGLWSPDLRASVSALLKAFSLPPLTIFLSLLLILPNLPFTHILLPTSLSLCAMVAQSLLFPAAMQTPRLFNSWVHRSIQLGSQSRVFLTAAPLKRLLTVPDDLSGRRSVPFSIVSKLKVTLSPKSAALPGLATK